MATAQERKPCAKCPKGVGVTSCDGCQQSFCIKHIIEHRQELATKLDYIGQEHDSLRRDLSQKDAVHPLLSRIDQWEEASVIKIRTTANIARADLRQMLDQIKNDLRTSVDKITDELQTHRELDDYTETDLTSWSTKLTDVRKLLETPATIQIVEDENISNIIRLIKVLEQKQSHLSSETAQLSGKSLSTSQMLYGSIQEIFDKVTDGLSLSEGGLVATYTGELGLVYPTILGKNFYRSGVHDIHFRVENKGFDNFFFGIVTSSQNSMTNIFRASSANGWWGFDVYVVNGVNQHDNKEKILRKDDVVKLTLDCNTQEIRLQNDRTKITLKSHIDITTCPFPWKIAVSLGRSQDSLRILC